MKSFIYRMLWASLCLLLISGCGRSWVADQRNPEYSAVTLYAQFFNGFFKEIGFRNLDTGRRYSNTRVGWGKEFFPPGDRLSFAMVANLPPGRYVLDWFRYYQGSVDRTLEVEVLDPGGAFEVGPGQIVYLGGAVGRWGRLAEERRKVIVTLR